MELAIAGNEPDIILITEILPKAHCNTLTSARLSLCGYSSVFNFDPDTTSPFSVRGVGIYVSEKLSFSEVHFDTCNFVEHIWIQVKLRGHDSLLVGCIYRSPSSDLHQSTINLCDLMLSIQGYSHVLICGDFNYPNINWSSLSCTSSCSQMFLDSIHDSYLSQHVTEPTHYRLNTTANVLDLVFTNEEAMINTINYLPGIGSSDHVCLQFNLLCYSTCTKASLPRYNLHQANFHKMRNLIEEVNWDEILSPLDIHSAWQIFVTKFTDFLDDCIPLDVPRRKLCIFMNQRALNLRNRKRKLWNKYTRSSSRDDYLHYCQIRNELRNLTRRLRSNYENKLVSRAKENPRQLWKYINSQLKVHPSIDSIRNPDNTISHSDGEKCESLNGYFAGVFTREDLSSVPSFYIPNVVDPLSDIEFTPQEVYGKLSTLNPAKASGPDGWPILSLKECGQQLSVPLSILFNKSFNSSTLPDAWKEALVTPIFKKGDRTIASNYRPISLTSPIVKMMESIIRDRIMDHMVKHNLFTPHQHGFTAGRSCVTQLLTSLNDWTKSLERGHSVDIIYFDFAKAFDSVPHTRLLTKLESYGLTGNLLGWLKGFLVGRKQRVVINGETSTWCNVLSGVPQGSVLGPLLFNIYVNDIPIQVSSCVLQFADDFKMYRVIHNAQDFQQLQDDINKLYEWANKWQLKFNISKCFLLHLGPPHEFGEYNINGTTISSSDTIKDLGVLIDENLKFHSHTASVITRANRTLAIVHKTFNFTDNHMFLALYKSLIRPVIEYGNTIWGPHYALDQQNIEKIQRRATRALAGLQDISYTDRLRILGLPSLQYRRLRGDMILLYRLVNNDIGVDFSDFFTISSSTVTRGHMYKLYKPHATTRARHNFFSIRSVNSWNSLPDYVVTAQSLDVFKNQLDNFFSDQMTQIDF